MIYARWLEKPDFTDADVATVLAHEVGHGLARHSSESLSRSIVLGLLGGIIISKADPVNKVHVIKGVLAIIDIINAFFSRRREVEADRIGMMLMAAAGYDPRRVCRSFARNISIPRAITGQPTLLERKELRS
ncbi:OLC1v1024947C1 [Oldenlandia corymbosa var. corymbosa]|uniref:OLC1v1024947C1 n=1 Tax=Oldenlandia corymbosa var. corymbosa TaxID=529605 RepID=A0AAV1C3K2_OLDCO|nr:OLC1v1024947C1 [Oldenlandia corymbosa var. corymbosa]